jgi:hypothetical protein
MPVLADALEDAGCDDHDLLGHCRQPDQVHVRGCWVLGFVLGAGPRTAEGTTDDFPSRRFV